MQKLWGGGSAGRGPVYANNTCKDMTESEQPVLSPGLPLGGLQRHVCFPYFVSW